MTNYVARSATGAERQITASDEQEALQKAKAAGLIAPTIERIRTQHEEREDAYEMWDAMSRRKQS